MKQKAIKLKTSYIKVLMLFLIMIPFLIKLHAQPKYYSKSKKAIAKFESALRNYGLLYFEQAIIELNQAIAIDNKFIDAHILLGQIAVDHEKKHEAATHYQMALSIDESYNPLVLLKLAEIHQALGNYSEAIRNYNKFMAYEKFRARYSVSVQKSISQCNFALEALKTPVEFKPQNLGQNINTQFSEYWPSLTADDSVLVFTSSDRQKRSQEDLFYSRKAQNGWGKAQRIGPPINTDGSEGAQTISADGNTMVYTACLRSDGFGSCDLYIAKKKGNVWTKPVNMGNTINSAYKESQPSLSADGTTLYFSSNRPGGKGKFDIWKSTQTPDGSWEVPINLGDSINTPEEELAPFIHYDNLTLYFTSAGHLGMGGTDIFFSRKNSDGNWQKAINAGYPINTHFDEESMIVSSTGDFGLFSSDMEGGFGQKDIYQFKLPEQFKPNKVLFAKGMVYDAKTNIRLQAKINVFEITGKSKYKAESDEKTGEFLICLPPSKSYSVNVNKAGYMIYSETLSISDTSLYVLIPLIPVEIGLSSVLKNIFFEYDSYVIQEGSFDELDQLIEFLKANKVIIEIQGHTDNSGSVSHNLRLSENRAKAVFDYIIAKGVNIKHVKYKGYGSTKPIADNKTETGRAKNRRTEFQIIAKQ
jgi:outer membrane protein OmpA-like peptidoglycan-associated protein/tetratricopeptide (TPR) repeat protein